MCWGRIVQPTLAVDAGTLAPACLSALAVQGSPTQGSFGGPMSFPNDRRDANEENVFPGTTTLPNLTANSCRFFADLC